MKKNKLEALKEVESYLRAKNLAYGFLFLKDIFNKKENEDFYNLRPGESINPFELNPKDKIERLKDLEKRYPLALSIAFPYAYHDWKYENDGISIYSRGEDYHRIVNGILGDLVAIVESHGFTGESHCDTSLLPERYMAIKANLGHLGKNGLIYVEDYGSLVFLGELLINMEIRENCLRDGKIYYGEDCERDLSSKEEGTLKAGYFLKECLTCNSCVLSCPGRVLGGDYQRTLNCLSYLSQKKDLDDRELVKLKGRVFGCDTCQIVCPVNKRGIIKEGLKELQGKGDYKFDEEDLILMATMDKAYFMENYRSLALSWRGKTLLQRNALAALYNKGIIIDLEKIKAPLLKEWYKNFIESER